MPELPEVEIIRLGLSKKLIGLTIKKVEALSPKSFIGNPKKLQGKKVLDIFRKAKVLGINLNDNTTILIHLKMSGQLIWQGKIEKVIGGHPTLDMLGQMPNKSTRVIFEFSNPLRPRSEASGSKLYFNDQRRFGWIKVINSDQLSVNSSLQTLGPEPLEKNFTWQLSKQQLSKRRKTAIKVAIMDQSVISGIGNIYAAEALFLAKIDPCKLVEKLTDADYKRLHQGIVEALKTGIKYGGSTRTHFVDPEGKKGLFLDYAYVYGKAGKECKICKTMLQTIRMSGRSTTFCPKCQR